MTKIRYIPDINYKALTDAERNQLSRAVRRPMRTTKEAERITARTVIAAAEMQKRFMTKVFQILPTPPRIQFWKETEIRQQLYKSELKAVSNHGACCSHKAGNRHFTEEEMNQIEREFIELMGGQTNQEINEAAMKFINDFYGFSTGVNRETPYKRGLWDIIKDSFAWAFLNMERTWKRQIGRSRTLSEQIPFEVLPLESTDIRSLNWVAEFYENGFSLVETVIFNDNVTGIKNTVIQMLNQAEPASWSEIALQLNKSFGEGGLWRWQRLIRTEFASAIQRASLEQYKEGNINWVQWDAALGRCPICDSIDQSTGRWSLISIDGIYRMIDVPVISSDTHPNCRCRTHPVWNLPKSARQFFGEDNE